MNLKNLITEAEARDQLRLPEHTLRRLRRLKRGPRWVRLGRTIYYKLDDLDVWVRACTTTPSDISTSAAQQEGGDHE